MDQAVRQEPEAEPQGRAPVLGIDLGTSYARVGIWQDGDVTLIPNEYSAVSTPCWVAFTESGVLVGETALEQATANMENTIFAPQRLIGCRIDSPWVHWYSRLWPHQLVQGEDDRPLLRVLCAGQEQVFRPEELVAMILSSLRRSAERRLGRTVVDACVTVPARYGRMQREAIVEACRIARLNAIHLLKAPTAAALAYTLTNRSRTNDGTFLVCDMGSSYFDFVVLKADNGHLTERAFGTDYVDLDKNLLNSCIEELREKWGISIRADRAELHRLQRACELAKRHLSTYSRARIELRNLAPNLDYTVVLSRASFEELVLEDLGPVLEPIGDCLEDCGLERSDLREVVIVGGSSQIPVIKKAFCDFFYGAKPVEVIKPEHAAVLGAASYAAALDGRRAGDVPPELQHLEIVEALPWSELPRQSQAQGVTEHECVDKLASRLASAGVGLNKPVDDLEFAQCAASLPPKPRTRPAFHGLSPPLSLIRDVGPPRPAGDPLEVPELT